MPRGKSAASGVNKMGLVREALGALGGDPAPAEIDAYIKEKHGVEISKQIISSYKSMIKGKAKKKAGKAGKPGRKPRAAGGTTLLLADLATVRGLVSRLGAAQVKQLVDVLA